MSDYFERIERQLVDQIEAGARPDRLHRLHRHYRPRRPKPAGRVLVPALAVLAVLVVGAVFLTARGGSGHPATGGGVAADEVTFTATPTAPAQSLSAEVANSLPVLRARLRAALPHTQLRVTGSGTTVTVTQPGRALNGTLRRRITALAATGRLDIYDWEGSVLTSGGRPAAAGLARQERGALLLSQGTGTHAPGEVGAGSVSAAQALRLAAHIRATRRGAATYYALAAGCAAPSQQSSLTAGCALVGPALKAADLAGMSPPRIGPVSSPVRVSAGVVIVQAASDSSPSSNPTGQFFVLRGDPALDTAGIQNAWASTDQTGSPDVAFNLTASGARRFARVTATVAHRGQAVSGTGLMLDQHFAFVVDGQILSVPSIDFRTYPDGVKTRGADITDNFTPADARDVAAVLCYGPLPVLLTPR